MKQLDVIYNELNSLMYSNFIYENEYEFLYHYTDLDSAKSIIENEQFWVSDAFTTNDKKEIIHMKDIIDSIVKEKYQNMEEEKKDIYLSAFDRACDILKLNTFILCFSLIKDSKPLWNDYANKGGKKGVCMRFDFNKINPDLLTELQSQKRFFLDDSGNDVEVELLVLNHYVTYSNKEKRTKIEEYLKLVTDVLNRINLVDFDDTLYKSEFELLILIFTDILLYSFLSKDSSWKSEEEFRMVFIFPDIIKCDSIFKVRKRGAQDVKYVSLNMKSNNTFSINRIFVKNKRDLDIVKKTLKPVIKEDIKIKVI